jgi:hypothetical protein
MRGRKYDKGKVRYELLPPAFIEAVAKVLTYGAAKYDDDNWLKIDKERYYGALMRHIIAWRKGENLDRESGLPHLAHAACNLLFLMHYNKNLL